MVSSLYTYRENALKAVGEAEGQNGIEARVVGVVLNLCLFGGDVGLKAGIGLDRLTAELLRIADRAGEVQANLRIADVGEAHLKGNDDVAGLARDQVAPSEGEHGAACARSMRALPPTGS